MRSPGGYALICDPVSGLREMDTFTCKHCNGVKYVRPKERPEDLGGLCKVCMGLICGPCVNDGTCVPFEKKLEQVEARDRARRSYGI